MHVHVKGSATPEVKPFEVRAAQDERPRKVCEAAGAFGGARLKQPSVLFGRSRLVERPSEGAADGIGGCPGTQWQRAPRGEVETDVPKRKIEQDSFLASSPTYTYN
jgi:hypothetical protein